MTTVGYGDFYPISHEGRALACIVCLLGNFYVAVLCVAFENSFELSNAEERSALII